VATSFETALLQWREGERRMAGAPPHERPALEAAVAAIEAELRRRLGGTFTTDELTELLLRQPQHDANARRGWAESFAEPRGEIQQTAREPTRYVEERCVFAALAETAKPPGKHLQQLNGNRRRLAQ